MKPLEVTLEDRKAIASALIVERYEVEKTLSDKDLTKAYQKELKDYLNYIIRLRAKVLVSMSEACKCPKGYHDMFQECRGY